ncbi:MAG: hypothetical protein ACHQ3P_03840 [Candidatus Limnocylindrales bacterium]
MDTMIECPWCAEPAALGDPAATEFHCGACATTVDLVDEWAEPARPDVAKAA